MTFYDIFFYQDRHHCMSDLIPSLHLSEAFSNNQKKMRKSMAKSVSDISD